MQGLVGLVHPDVRMLVAMVDGRLNDYATAARIRAVNRVRLDGAPLAGRPPVLGEIAVGIFRILVRMLFPGCILLPDSVSGFDVLML